MYDWDFRNMKFFNSSQPYTPVYSFMNNMSNTLNNNNEVGTDKKFISLKPSQNNLSSSFISSLGSNHLNGMLRATQN